MIIPVLLLCLFAVLSTRRNHVVMASDVLERDVTIPINGFFVMLVFIDHFTQVACKCGYTMNGIGDTAYILFRRCLTQFHVVSFLFLADMG